MTVRELPVVRDRATTRRQHLVARGTRARNRTQQLVDDATVLARSPLSGRRPAWVLVLAVDLLCLFVPAAVFWSVRGSLVAFALVEIALLQSGGRYRSRLHLRVLDELPAFVGRTAVAWGVIAAATYAVQHDEVGRFTAIVSIGVIAQLFGRALSYRIIRWARAKDVFCHPAVIIGAGEVGQRLAETLRHEPHLGLRPVGYVADGQLDVMPADLRKLGSAATLSEAIEASGATVVIVAFNDYVDSALVEALRTSERRGRDLFIVPRLFEFTAYGQTEDIGGIPIVRVQRPRLNRGTWLVKRTMDVLLSSVALLLLSPLMALVAIGVRLEGGPGIIFRQARIGLDGRQFQLMKFRSMKPADESESATRWNISTDDRVGPVGKVLRKTSIDELPQLFNVLLGDMTLVGPRPERPHFVHEFSTQIPSYRHRHRVPAGMTGLAQVNGLRGDTSIADRARYDNFYIENWSLWLDVKIMAATLREVVGARGA